MAFETQVREGGAWRTGLLVSAHEGGTWRDVQEIWAREGGAWRQVYVRSDPITLNFGAAWSQAYTEGGDKISYTFAADDMIQGDWDTVGHASGTQRGKGAAGYTGIESAFGGRYACTAASFRLTVKSAYTSNGIYPRIGVWQNFLSTTPTTFGHVHSDYQNTGVRTKAENTVTTALTTAAGNTMLNSSRNTVTTHDFGDGTSSSAKELYRGSFYGYTQSSSIYPRLTLTADYV